MTHHDSNSPGSVVHGFIDNYNCHQKTNQNDIFNLHRFCKVGTTKMPFICNYCQCHLHFIFYSIGLKDDDVKIDMEIEDNADVERPAACVTFLRRMQAANRVVIDPDSTKLAILSNIVCILIIITSLTTIFQVSL